MKQNTNKIPQPNSNKAKRLFKEIGLFIVDILYNAVIIIALVVLIRSFLISPFRVIGASMSDTLHSNEFILIDKLSYNIGTPERGDPIVFTPPITRKYLPKFEEAMTTDEDGVAKLDLSELRTSKNVIYCQNDFVKKFWFCKDKVNKNDLVYFRPISNNNPEINSAITWDSAEKRNITDEEIKNKEMVLVGDANQSYAVRIYSSTGPEFFVKRIIGIPGDQVKIENGLVYLKKSGEDNFVEINEPYLNSENSGNTYFNQKEDVASNIFIVPENRYFVLGDNRNHSNDSRSWYSPIDQELTPYVDINYIDGKVLVVLWPLSDVRFIKGAEY
ncbi:signal peptidase I [Candidatus Peregrinibacteria bacterium]|nr:signal peptidase I [Candidatus Peregrinibacteria bacterium]